MKHIVLFFLLMPLTILAQSNTLFVQGDVVNIRKEPNAQAEVVAKAKRLERLTVLQKSNQDVIGGITDFWYQVKTENGKVGFVFGNFTSLKLEGQKIGVFVLSELYFGDCFHLVLGDIDFGLAYNNYGSVDDLTDDADSETPKYLGKKFKVTYNDLYTMYYEACNPDLPGKLIKTETIVGLQLVD